MQVKEFIRKLEDRSKMVEPDDVAEFLYILDAKEGVPGGGGPLCPIEIGVKMCLPEDYKPLVTQEELRVRHETGGIYEPYRSSEKVVHHWTNPAVKVFISMFDSGWYPELLASYIDRPDDWEDEAVAGYRRQLDSWL